jgi:hypothetical protein
MKIKQIIGYALLGLFLGGTIYMYVTYLPWYMGAIALAGGIAFLALGALILWLIGPDPKQSNTPRFKH